MSEFNCSHACGIKGRGKIAASAAVIEFARIKGKNTEQRNACESKTESMPCSEEFCFSWITKVNSSASSFFSIGCGVRNMKMSKSLVIYQSVVQWMIDGKCLLCIGKQERKEKNQTFFCRKQVTVYMIKFSGIDLLNPCKLADKFALLFR